MNAFDPLRDSVVPLDDVSRFDAIARSRLSDLLRRMPKAELHVHIEGCLEPEMVLDLAHRNHVALPYANVAALRHAYRFSDLQSFLDVYYTASAVLRTERDFHELGMHYFGRAAEDNVVHAELFFDPQAHIARGVPMAAVIGGLARACAEAGDRYGITSALIMCFLRHLSEDSALATLEQALPFRDHFVGVGLDSSELGHPPSKFARLFERCRALGLRRVAHAGEEGPPEYILEALDLLHVERIDHGVSCLDDLAVTRRLAQARIPLTVCPLSNVVLCVFETMAEHNLPALLDAGLNVTINSDDPAYFGGYVGSNFAAAFKAFERLGPAHAYRLARNSLEASFASGTQKRNWIHQLDQVFEATLASAYQR